VSQKKENTKNGTPGQAQNNKTFQSQKQGKPVTPKSQNSNIKKTPQSQEVKFQTPQSAKGTPQTGKQPKVDTPYPHSNKGPKNGSAQKGAQPSPKATTPHIQGKQTSSKKRKLSDAAGSDSAEEDFEVYLLFVFHF